MLENAKPTRKKRVPRGTSKRGAAHKQIADFIFWFAEIIYGTKPDKSEYSRWYKFVQPLMESDEDGLRVYTIEELQRVITMALEDGIIVKTLSILSYPDILRGYVDNDTILRQRVIKSIKEQQKEIQAEAKAPDGW